MSQDTITPKKFRVRSEHYPASPKALAVKPERNLLAAILGRTILDLYGEVVSDRLTIASARNWLYSPLDFDREFSFGWVAMHLDLDPLILREKLKVYHREPENMLKCLNYLR